MPASPGSVYQNSNSTGGTTTFTVTPTFLAGDTAVLFVKVSSGTSITSISDSVNGTTGWVKATGPATAGGGDLYVYYRNSMAAGSPVVTLTEGTSDSFQALACVNISTTNGFDACSTYNVQTTGNTRTSNSATPSTSGLAIGFNYNDTNNNGGAIGAGWSALTGSGVTGGHFWTFGTGNNFAWLESLSYSSGAQSSTFNYTANNTSTTGSVVVLFQDPASGGNIIAWTT